MAHAGTEVREGGEGASLLPLGQHRIHKAPAHALEGGQSESDVIARYGKAQTRLVDIGGQQSDAVFLTFGNVLRHLVLRVQHRGKQSRHILSGVVALKPRRLIGHNGVAHGVGLVEGVVGKGVNFIIDGLGILRRNTPSHTTFNVALGVAVDKGLPLPLNVLDLLLTHGPAHHVCLAQRVSRQAAENLNDLLLVDDTPIGHGQNGLQSGIPIGNAPWVLLAGDKLGDGVHGTGAVQGDDSGDVLNVLGLEAHAHPRHARRLHLEHPRGMPLGEHTEHLRVIVSNLAEREVRVVLLDHLHCVVQNGQVPKAQKVHFQKAQFFQGHHGVLGHRHVIVGGQGHVLIYRTPGNDHASGVGGGVAGHAFQLPSHIHQLLDLFVAVVQVCQTLGQHQRLVQSHIQGKGHLLGNGIHLGVGHVHHSAHVPDGRLGLHGTKGDDLGHVVLPVLPGHVVDDLLTAADAEVNVNIRHGHSLRVEESLEVQGVLHGVNVGDIQAVGHHGPRSGTTPRAHGNALALGVADEVGDDEEVVHKAHAANHVHLHLQPLLVLLPGPRVPLLEALAAQALKIGVPVRLPFRQLERRQVVDSKLEVHLTHLGNLGGILYGLRALGKEGAHLLFTLDVELLGLKAHAVGVLQPLARLDAHEHILHHRVLSGEVVGVVGGHQGNPRLSVEAENPGVHRLLLVDAVVLNLQVVAVLPKDVPHLQGVGQRPLVVPRHEPPGNFPAQAGRQGDEALTVGPQQLHIHPRSAVKALHIGHGHQIAEVAVPRLIFTQQHQVAGGAVQLSGVVEPGPGCHIHLTADDGLDARPQAGPVKVHSAEHHSVVGDGHSLLPQLLDPLHQLLDAAGPVQQGVFRMYM